MKRFAAGLLLVVVASLPLSGQTNRTIVSVVGNDLNSCTPAAPCRSFSRALTMTNPGGEVVAVDSGGYGPFTADRAATIAAAPGVYAGISAPGANGVVVNAGAGASVVLKNLTINGLGSGNDGIAHTFNGAVVYVESCQIQGFFQGIETYFTLRVDNTTIRQCTRGIWVDNAGGAVKATINHTYLKNNGALGLQAFRNAVVTARDVVANGGSDSVFIADSGQLNLENCLATAGNAGVRAQNGGTVRMSNTMAVDNTVGVSNAGTIVTWGNNKVAGNVTNNAGTAMVAVTQD